MTVEYNSEDAAIAAAMTHFLAFRRDGHEDKPIYVRRYPCGGGGQKQPTFMVKYRKPVRDFVTINLAFVTRWGHAYGREI